MIRDSISSLEGLIFLPEVGAINIKQEIHLRERSSDKFSLGQENDLTFMTQLWDVPSVGNRSKVAVLRF